MVPVQSAAKTLVAKVGFSPGLSSPAMMFLTGTYRPILNPANTIYLWRPAVKPLYKALVPSSLEMTAIVLRNPLYLGAIVLSIYFA
jgi:hypothetical protein